SCRGDCPFAHGRENWSSALPPGIAVPRLCGTMATRWCCHRLDRCQGQHPPLPPPRDDADAWEVAQEVVSPGHRFLLPWVRRGTRPTPARNETRFVRTSDRRPKPLFSKSIPLRRPAPAAETPPCPHSVACLRRAWLPVAVAGPPPQGQHARTNGPRARAS